MSKSLAETLVSMADDQARVSNTARLRAVFAHVENAQKSGVSRQAILEALQKDGCGFTMQTFEKALYRIRKEKSNLTATAKTPIQPQNEVTPSPKMNETESSSQELKKISRTDFRKIREDTMKNTDWLALSQPVDSKT